MSDLAVADVTPFGQTEVAKHAIVRYVSLVRLFFHDDVIKWKHFPRYWPFVRGIHRSPVNSPHKGQWRGALMFTLICVWINGCVNNREAGDLRRYCAHYGVTVMYSTKVTLFRRNHSDVNIDAGILIGTQLALNDITVWTRVLLVANIVTVLCYQLIYFMIQSFDKNIKHVQLCTPIALFVTFVTSFRINDASK